MYPNHILSNAQTITLNKYVARRGKGEPIAYIIGYKYFYGLKFKVNKSVLIPRPETEWIIDRVMAKVKSRKYAVKRKTEASAHSRSRRTIQILDVGTGSGCIPICIAHELKQDQGTPDISIFATDISPTALVVAKNNAKTHKTKVTFAQSDLFKNSKGWFDIITANLPYVPFRTYMELYADLRYEPQSAITDNTEHWILYERFFKTVNSHLKPKGIAILEIDQTAKAALTTMTKRLIPTYRCKFHRDSASRWRYLEIRKP